MPLIAHGRQQAVTVLGQEIASLQTQATPIVVQSLPSLPLPFQKNVGQGEQRFSFFLRSVNFAVGFTPTAIAAAVNRHAPEIEQGQNAVMSQGNAILLNFMGANPAQIIGEDVIKGKIHTVVSQDKTRWHTNIPSYNRLTYRGLYPGIQMFAHADQARLEYGFLLDPEADLDLVRVNVEGATKLTIDQSGNLIMHTSGGPILQTKPHFVEVKGNDEKVLKGNFVLLGPKIYGFKVENRSPNAQLLIDPEIIFATYFGGSGNEGMLGIDQGADDFIGLGFDIAVGPTGHIHVIGMTTSADFPTTTTGAISGSSDVFILRIDPTSPPGQQLVYATFIGGSSSERGRAVEPFDDEGRVYITGHTSSSDFPTSTGVVQQTILRSGAYVARLAPDGEFEVGTMIGSTASYHPNSVVFSQRSTENEGFVYVAGSVQIFSNSEATSESFQLTFGGGQFDGFLVKLDANLTRYEYFTYLGGSGRDVIMDLDVNDGFAFVTGTTTSIDFPTTELATQAQHSQANTGLDCTVANRPRQCFDAFVARFNRNGNSLVYSTFLGSDREEYARGIGVASNNQATVTGAARSTSGGQTEIFVARIEGGGENLLWDRRLIGQGTDHGEELVVDQLGRTHFVGTVSIDGLATADTFHGGRSDIFYGRITDAGDMDYRTYLGGTGQDRGFAIASVGSSEENFCVFIAGSTTSDDIQTVNALPGGEERGGGADLLLYGLCDIVPDIIGSDFSKSAPSSVAEGTTFRYMVTVNNGGDQPIPVTISDRVPNNVTVTDVRGPGCGRTGNNVTCSFSASPVVTTIEIYARAGEQCPATVTNTATIQVGNQEFSASATTQINCVVLCGNGRTDPGEECDGGANCRANCRLIQCGDGILDRDRGEQCDDGNRNNLDRCTNQCRRQPIREDSCSETGPACAGDLICGQRATYVECDGLSILDMCIFGWEGWLLYTDDPSCMPQDDATWIIGP